MTISSKKGPQFGYPTNQIRLMFKSEGVSIRDDAVEEVKMSLNRLLKLVAKRAVKSSQVSGHRVIKKNHVEAVFEDLVRW